MPTWRSVVNHQCLLQYTQCENSKKNIAKRGEITFDHEADFRIEWKDLATVQRSMARYGKWDGEFEERVPPLQISGLESS
jgi:hypothetical protein